MHSWRVLILPYIGEDALYNTYKFDEPWDGPNNIKLLNQIPRLYACPSTPSSRAVARLPAGFGILACGGPVTTASGAPNKFTC